jgi:hypothetical protein
MSFLGRPGRSFSYPYGQFPDSAQWLIAHSGFYAATIIGQAKQCTSYASMYELTRLGVSGTDTVAQFATKLNSGTCP